jgi:hypothetical protein
VDLNGHEAGNGGYSQRKPTAHLASSTRSETGTLFPFALTNLELVWGLS